MKLDPARIKTNDFPEEQKEFVEALGGILNPFVDKLLIAFNKNLTVDDNLPFEFKTLDIKVDPSGVPLVNQNITTKLTNFKGFVCLNVLDLDNTGNLPSTCPFLITKTSANNIKIVKITGLSSNITYRLVLLGIS
jgi:hypothetical protein